MTESAQTISIGSGDDVLATGTALILVPAAAATEPGFIQTVSTAGASTAKHDLHALAQMAAYDFSDELLHPIAVATGAELTVRGESGDAARLSVADGIAIVRNADGAPVLLAFEGADVRGLLREAHRFTTRWIRLDVG